MQSQQINSVLVLVHCEVCMGVMLSSPCFSAEAIRPPLLIFITLRAQLLAINGGDLANADWLLDARAGLHLLPPWSR